MTTPTDEQVQSYIDSVPGLRDEWGITSSRRMGTIAFVLMNAFLVAITIGVIAYFVLVDPRIAHQGVSGLVIVLVLAYVVSAIRFFQLRAERVELPAFRKALVSHLTGNPETDVETQTRVETEFRWESLRYRTVARMIGIAGLIILTINTYQTGMMDYGRILLFDGAILVYLTGAFWNNYAFKTDLLEVELQERSRATIRWQTEHPNVEQQDASGVSGESPSYDAKDEDAPNS